jgi:hypothetical protein
VLMMCVNRLLFVATTIASALHVWRMKGTGNTKHDPAVEVHPTAAV